MSSSLPGANRRQEMGCFQVRQGGLVSLNRLHAGYKKVYGKRGTTLLWALEKKIKRVEIQP